MRNRMITGAAVAALAVPLGAFGALGVAPAAHAATGSGSASYACQLSGGLDRNTDVSVQVDLSVPDSVTAGDTATATGTLRVKLPEDVRREARASWAANATLSSSTMSLVVTVGGESRNIVVSVPANKQKLSSPVTYTYDISLSDVTVPENATGALEVSLPGNGYATNTANSSSTKVAFNAVIAMDGVTRSRNLACALPSSANPRVASVPVTARAETPAPDPGGETGGPGDGSGSGGTGGSGGGGGTGGSGGSTGGGGAFGLPTIPGGGSDFGAFDPPASGGSAGVAPPGGTVPGTPKLGSLLSPGSALTGSPDGETPVPLAPGLESRADQKDTADTGLPPQTRTGLSLPSNEILVGVAGAIVLLALGVLLPARLHLRRRREEAA
ncbi:putative membrane protein YgcG [Nocardioides daedukensis]|uniref:Putative membrane protein YgcG n=1 Tax=Nocardioides daedukensis TaxID=634462 RepID=A0A7Y9S0G4_9ACTN|nr:DUF6801 domain-containing protein [Nocardioides daedukensis]NYG59650.1 putative membrane protein YgcG [Nocardioides daedukensis]